jgi:hypothetical protein
MTVATAARLPGPGGANGETDPASIEVGSSVGLHVPGA